MPVGVMHSFSRETADQVEVSAATLSLSAGSPLDELVKGLRSPVPRLAGGPRATGLFDQNEVDNQDKVVDTR